MASPMDPHERIGSWLSCTEPCSFVNCVNHDGEINQEEGGNPILKDGTVNVHVISKAYNKIHDYLRSSLGFFNSYDADILNNLAERVKSVGEKTNFKDPEEEQIFNIASKLKKLNYHRFSVQPSEISLLPPSIQNVVEGKFSLQDVIEIVASGHLIAKSIVEITFFKLDSQELMTFIDQSCLALIRAQNCARLRAVGYRTEPEGISLAKQDAVIFHIRTFCNLARRSSKAEDLFTEVLKCIDLYARKNDDEQLRNACRLISSEITTHFKIVQYTEALE